MITMSILTILFIVFGVMMLMFAIGAIVAVIVAGGSIVLIFGDLIACILIIIGLVKLIKWFRKKCAKK